MEKFPEMKFSVFRYTIQATIGNNFVEYCSDFEKGASKQVRSKEVNNAYRRIREGCLAKLVLHFLRVVAIKRLGGFELFSFQILFDSSCKCPSSDV